MRLSTALGSLLILIGLFFVSPVFAGGGPVEFWVDPNTSLSPGEVYVVHARVSGNSSTYPNYCQNCLIHLKFQNPQDGDVVNQSSERTDENGQVYAKVVSTIPGKRIIYATDLQDSNGKLMETGNYVELNYTGQSNLPSIPVENLYATINTQYVNGVKRLINVNWNFLPDIIKVNVYARMADNKDYGAALASSSMMYPRSAQIGLGSYFDWYVKVEACKTADSCVSSSEIFVPAMKKDDNSIPSGSMYIKVGTQKYLGGPKRQVTLSWNKVEDAVKYNVYARLADMNEYGSAIEGTGSLSTQVGINAFLDYYIKVDACNSAGCISSSEVFVPRMKKEEGGTIVAPSSSIVIPSSTNSSNTEELNKKIENLQNQLDQSKKTQSVLEQRVNDLLSFIKKLFPFFR